ncbi:MAG: hypothetical protein PHY14_02110 [Candidatus Gracilibacteria bacterium]|nr:hypothetical protein [Candidatus Gracilibacteria bacterium]
MSDPTITGALIGAIGAILGILISIFSQFLYFHLIEKGKLRKEREFSFLKESFFQKQEKCFELLTLTDEILIKLKNKPSIDVESFAENIKLKYILFNTTLSYLPDLKKDIESYGTNTSIIERVLQLSNLLNIEDNTPLAHIQRKNLDELLESYGKEYEETHDTLRQIISTYLIQEQQLLLNI